MKDEISIMLIEIFCRIGIDIPSNFDQILDFLVDDVHSSADKENWHNEDVSIAFRRWIESNTSD